MITKPTPEDLDAAHGTSIPDVIAEDLDVLFVGINPSLYSGATGRSAAVGEQPGSLAGRKVWLLPNPSGLNAHYSLDDLAELYGRLRREVRYRAGRPGG